MAIAHRDQIDFSKYSLMDKLRVGVLAGVGHLVPMPVLFKLQRLAAAKDRKRRRNTGITAITSRIISM